jgi:hypothetical protein
VPFELPSEYDDWFAIRNGREARLRRDAPPTFPATPESGP